MLKRNAKVQYWNSVMPKLKYPLFCWILDFGVISSL